MTSAAEDLEDWLRTLVQNLGIAGNTVITKVYRGEALQTLLTYRYVCLPAPIDPRRPAIR
jgi:hypothetical protein